MAGIVRQASQINITLGTAGHIDHGKTALIKLLTGCETDRLKAEKDRGMSIELGFAPCVMGDSEVGIVDVPGHENFIKTMVAGATSIDAVIFVVAADDSIMPQTREHLDILKLLGIRQGIVALTKIDIVSPDRVKTVTDDLKKYLQGTFLENADICPLSSITGLGFDVFRSSLDRLIKNITPRSIGGVFRLPIERAFSIKGFGTVVSGIPCAGAVKVSDELVLLPAAVKSRIKTVQVYSRGAEIVKSGQCAALNLPQIDYKFITRGDVLTIEGYFEPQQWFLCKLSLLDNAPLKLKNGSKVKLHTGTTEVTASIYFIDDPDAADEPQEYIQLRTERAIIAGPADYFILRSLTPPRTIGGGMIIEAMGRKLKKTHLNFKEDVCDLAQAVLSATDFVEYAIRKSPNTAASLKEISIRTKLFLDAVKPIIERLLTAKTIIELAANLYIHSKTMTEVTENILVQVDSYHKQNPGRVGVERSAVLELSACEKKVFDAILNLLINQNKLILRKGLIALPTHHENFDPAQQELLEKVETIFKDQLFSPPKIEEVIAVSKKSASEIQNTVNLLIEQQILTRVAANMLFHCSAIVLAKQKLVDYIDGEGQGKLDSVHFKYILNTTRKFALPLLDYMDKMNITRRIGNTRYLKQ